MRIRSFLLATTLSIPLASRAKPLIIEVDAGKHDRAAGLPLICELPVGLDRPGSAKLDREGFPDPIPAQVIPGGKTRVVWLLEEELKAGQTRRYDLDLRTTGDSFSKADRHERLKASHMKCLETAEKIELIAGTSTILQYNKRPTAAAANHDPLYSRTGYIHPLNSPKGKMITGDYPADHPHQHALFFAWTNTTFEGRKINFWDQKGGTARIAYRSTIKTQSGPTFAQFAVNHVHEDLTAPEGPRPVLDERWLVRAYHSPGSTAEKPGDAFLIDIHSTQKAAGNSPLTINRYHYGGMAIRGANAWFVDDKEAKQPSDFLTSEGRTRTDGNHTRPNWVALHGSCEAGEKAGAAIFCHPENFRAPQPVRLHPSKPYFVFTPQVESGFAIELGKPYQSEYRYLVFDGEPDPELLERAWLDYAEPPEISIVKTP